VHLARGQFFLYQTIQRVVHAELAQASFVLEPRNFCILQIFKPSFKRLGSYEVRQSLLSRNSCTRLWQHAKMSTTLKTPDGLKDSECKKGQLSNWPPIPYIPMVDIVTPKEDPQIFKVKLLDDSHLSMPIYSCGNTEKYLTHIRGSSVKNVIFSNTPQTTAECFKLLHYVPI
jgi:hypothetical protein